jgi:hypothetical protein
MKPVLKAPGSMPLKLTYDEPLSSFAFKFNLRRYNLDIKPSHEEVAFGKVHVNAPKAGRCRLTLSITSVNRLEVSAWNWNMMDCFQTLVSKSTCAATPRRARAASS